MIKQEGHQPSIANLHAPAPTRLGQSSTAMTPQAICRALDVGRWIGLIAGFGLALRYSPDPADQLHVLAPWLVGSVSGLTGIESVFLGRAAAQLTGTHRAPTSGSPA